MNKFSKFIDEDDDIEHQVITIANPENCIGCETCDRICPQKCHTHEILLYDQN